MPYKSCLSAVTQHLYVSSELLRCVEQATPDIHFIILKSMFYLNLLFTVGVIKMKTLRDEVITSTWSRADALKVRLDDPQQHNHLYQLIFRL